MTPTAPRVKICGLTRRVDAECAAAAGAYYGGVILAPGRGRSVDPEHAAEVFRDLPLRRVGVFVDAPIAELLAAAELAELEVVQLHGDESPQYADAVAGSGRAVWKALRPRSGEEFAEGVERYKGHVEGILVDGWSPAAPGGTGTAFSWDTVAAGRDLLPAGVELIVAGGLNPGNVAAAVRVLLPETVDVSSGVESATGLKDARLVRGFVAAATGDRTVFIERER